jgi:hypothetical protein
MPIDFSNAWKTGVKIINEAISLLPNVVLAIVILLFCFSPQLASLWPTSEHSGDGSIRGWLFTSPVAVESTAANR